MALTLTAQGLGSTDWKKVGKGFVIAEGAAILTTATLWLQAGKFDLHELFVLESAAIVSTFINIIAKSLDGIKA